MSVGKVQAELWLLIGDPCEEWQGYRKPNGYGQVGRASLAHRAAWVEAHGEIPAGMYVCHACDNPPCVNVRHLWLGTNAENVDDMRAKGRRYGRPDLLAARDRCPHGHLFDDANTGRRAGGGGRYCRACRRGDAKRRRARRRQEREAAMASRTTTTTTITTEEQTCLTASP